MDPRPLILALRLEPRLQDWLDAQRRAHFPPERNVLAAHLTLFHALPAHLLDEVQLALTADARRPAFAVRITGLRSLGRGVAYEVASPDLVDLRAGFARRWSADLTPQDRQPFRPHVTVQNKVEPPVARALMVQLSRGFDVRSGLAVGLDLWRYDGGPWQAAGGASFTSSRSP